MFRTPSHTAKKVVQRKAFTSTTKAALCGTVFALLMATTNTSFATGRKCNVNEHCKLGWYCVKGDPTQGNDNSSLKGYCKPNIIARQLCTLDKALTQIVGRFVVLFGVVTIGWSFLQGKFEIKSVLTMIIGAALILAPFAVISMVTRNANSACDFEVTINDLGFLPV